MPTRIRTPLGVLAVALLLAGCGRGADDTLVDGAVDRPREGTSTAAAEDVGPPTPSSAAASPSGARVGTDAGTGAAAPGAGSPAASGPTLAIAERGPRAPYLVDAGGMAVYALEGDRTGAQCVGDCLEAWPPVLMGNVQPSGAAGLQGAMVSFVARPDGTRQVAYNGHPLYRYAGDGGAGLTNGHGVKDRYGTWFLVSPQGEAVAVTAATAGGAGGG